MNIRFDHSLFSMLHLHSSDIRSTKWLEEVFFDKDSGTEDITVPEDDFPIFFTVGFSRSMVPVMYVFEVPDNSGDDLLIVSKYCRKATKAELKKHFCS